MIVLPLILAVVFVAQAIYLNSDPGDYPDAVAAYSHLVATTGVTSAAFVLGMAGSITTRLRDRSSAGVLLRGIGHILQRRGRRAPHGVSSGTYYELVPHAVPLGIAAVAHVASQPMGPYVDLASLYVTDARSAVNSYKLGRGWEWTYLPWSTEQSELMAPAAFLDSPIRNDTCLPAHRPDVMDMTCPHLCTATPLDENDLSLDPSYSSVSLQDSPATWKSLASWFNVYTLCWLIVLSVLAIASLLIITAMQLMFPSDPEWLKLPVLLPSSLPTHWMVLVELVKDGEEPGVWALIPKPPTLSLWTSVGAACGDGLEDGSFTLEFELSLAEVEKRMLLINSDGELDLEIDLDSVDSNSDGILDDDDEVGACPIYASDCGVFPDSSSDMSLDTDSEDLDRADVECSADSSDRPSMMGLEHWQFTFTFGPSKISGMDDPQRPKILRRSVEKSTGHFRSGSISGTDGSNLNVAIPAPKRRRLGGPEEHQPSEDGQ
ncbi:hypothetical protein BDV93DRAFT_506815 [Ceratobasidium sp. AG-I]|nr:hypothetical protein BDV93DRAFT_506815 [Ceratobasidium sp. AG-I]